MLAGRGLIVFLVFASPDPKLLLTVFSKHLIEMLETLFLWLVALAEGFPEKLPAIPMDILWLVALAEGFPKK